VKSQKGDTPIHEALKHGKWTIVEVLLNNDSSIEEQEREGGLTPLMHSCMLGNYEMVNKLLGKGANIMARMMDSLCSMQRLTVLTR